MNGTISTVLALFGGSIAVAVNPEPMANPWFIISILALGLVVLRGILAKVSTSKHLDRTLHQGDNNQSTR